MSPETVSAERWTCSLLLTTKSLRKSNSLPSSMKYVNDESSDRVSVCSLFARYFDSVYNPVVEPAVEPIFDPFVHQTELADLAFTPAEVEEALKGFDKNKVASPDNIPMMLFMHLSLVFG